MTGSAYSVDWNQINNTLSQAILDRGLLEDLLGDLGCDLGFTRRGVQYRMPCPVHDGDVRNMEVTTGGYELPVRWCCYSRQCHDEYKPSLLGLVRGVLSRQREKVVRVREAAAFMARYAGDVEIEASATRARPEPEPVLLDLTREQVRRRLDIPSAYFLGRGFPEEVLDAFDVGYSGKLRRAVVPLYDETAQTCVGFLARSHRPPCEDCKRHHDPGQECRYGQPKWQAMSGFPRETYLYNYAAAAATAAPFVFLVEGAPDVFRLAEAGYVGVALLGCDASEAQLGKLAALGKEIWVAFDNDEAAEAARERLRKKSLGLRIPFQTFSAPKPYKDLGDTPADQLRREIGEQVEEMAAWDAECADPELLGIWFKSPEEALASSERRRRLHEEWRRRAATPWELAGRAVSGRRQPAWAKRV
jgi:hypothetical protein